MTKTITFTTVVIAILALALFAFTGIASAHKATSFDPTDSNCMGKLTAFHAKDMGGIRNSAERWLHRGIGGPHDGTVKGHQKLSQKWCKSE